MDELEEDPKDQELHKELLNLKQNLGLEEAEGQRVLQLAMVIRNLSFEEENMEMLSSDLLVFR